MCVVWGQHTERFLLRLFECQNCGSVVYFNNSACVNCGFRLGYIAELSTMSALREDGERQTALADPDKPYIFCANADDSVCNWLIPADSGQTFCQACRHNRTIPDLTMVPNWTNWAKLEAAKRQLFYSLIQWRLPMPDLAQDPVKGLVFDFLADTVGPDGGVVATTLTGHADGVITMNIAEADDAEREKRRTDMHEPYRTLLGHFRHEIGHYYWDRLVDDGGKIEAFRAVFGDETADYATALQHHYNEAPPVGWEVSFISTYATAHPWEDFAECWAHYMHMVDAIETARSFGISIRPRAANAEQLSTEIDFDPYREGDISRLVDTLVPLTVAMNNLNRSMGQPDFYPFVLSQPVVAKLDFIHQLLRPFAAARE